MVGRTFAVEQPRMIIGRFWTAPIQAKPMHRPHSLMSTRRPTRCGINSNPRKIRVGLELKMYRAARGYINGLACISPEKLRHASHGIRRWIFLTRVPSVGRRSMGKIHISPQNTHFDKLQHWPVETETNDRQRRVRTASGRHHLMIISRSRQADRVTFRV